ncbi:MAG: cation:proton antiporter [Methanobacteriota archaeon]
MVEILEVGIAFLVVAAGGYVAHNARLSVIPAYIVVGMLVGPYGLGIVKSSELISFMAEVGVILLLLFLGLEFSLKRLVESRKNLLIAGSIDLVINFSTGLILGLALGWSVLEAALLAGIVYMSSSGIITKALIDLRKIVNPETEVILGIMVFEDLFIALFLAVISGAALAGTTEPSIVLASVFKAVAFCAAFLIIAKKYNNIVDRAISIKSDEIFLLFLFSMAILVSAAAQRIGISGAIGAFFLGLAFSETQHVQRIERKIIPLRDLFASMFFFSFGMLIDVSTFPQVFTIAIAIPLLVLSKVISGYFAARVQDFSAKTSLFVGFSTVARGEFSVVLASLGVAAGVTPLLYPLTAIIVLVTSVLGILLMSMSDAVYRILARA